MLADIGAEKRPPENLVLIKSEVVAPHFLFHGNNSNSQPLWLVSVRAKSPANSLSLSHRLARSVHTIPCFKRGGGQT